MNSYINMLRRFPNPSHLRRGQAPIPRRLDPPILSGATMMSSILPSGATMMSSTPPSVLPPHLHRGDAPNTMEFSPEQSWWDKLTSGGIDWEQGIQDLAGMSFPAEEVGGMISGGKVGGRGGPTLADFSPISMGGGAPNPGWPLVHPRRKEEQYAGPFVPTQIWSLG